MIGKLHPETVALKENNFGTPYSKWQLWLNTEAQTRFPPAQTYWASRHYMLLHPHRKFQEAVSVAVLPASVPSLAPCQTDKVLCILCGSDESYSGTIETQNCKLQIKPRICLWD